jgi:hypothetical protein
MCKPMAICSIVGLAVGEPCERHGDGDGRSLSTGVECIPIAYKPAERGESDLPSIGSEQPD